MRKVRLILFALCSGFFWQCQPSVPHTALPDIAIHHAMILPMDSSLQVIESGHIMINEGEIVRVEVDSGQAPPQARKVLNGRGKLLMPGLINTHTHAPMTLFRGLADDLDLQDWLQQHIWPAEARYMQPDAIRLGTQLAMAEMIRSGTTTFNDMYFFVQEMAEEVDQAGMRAILSEGLLDFPTPAYPTPEAAMEATRQAAQTWANHPRVRIGVGPHSPYTLSAERLKAARNLADSLGTLLHIHVSETQTEVNLIQGQHGQKPPFWLNSFGFWGHRPTLVAHGVWLDSADRKLLIGHTVGLAHNPESNMKLASGIAPIQEWLAEGGQVGLGTDGASSNNNLDLLQEMHTTAKLHKVASLNPLAVNARQVVEMATIGGARVLGWEKEIGSLEMGKRADMILLNLDAAHAIPMYDPYAHLAYAAQAQDVETVIVDGEIIMQNRMLLTLNEADIFKQARALALEIKKADAEGMQNNEENEAVD